MSRRGAEAVAHLEGLLEQAAALAEASLGLAGEGARVDPAGFTAGYARAMAALGIGGANPNALFTAMSAVNQLRELGLRPESGAPGAPWSRLPAREARRAAPAPGSG